MRIKIFLVTILNILLIKSAQASASSLFIEAISKENGVSFSAFDSEDVKLSRTVTGFEVMWHRNPGEGTENCQASYRKDGTISQIECDLEYVSDSKGPLNVKSQIKASRYYDQMGINEKVTGHVKVTRLKNKKIVKNRKIISVKDAYLKELTKPLLKLSPEIMNEI